VPREIVGKSLRDAEIRKRHDVTVVRAAARRRFQYATPRPVMRAT
jgi:hypothetical protein